MTTTVLVTGGTGLTGRRVARRLTENGHRVRIGSRQGQPSFDWARPETWPAALFEAAAAGGPTAAYLCYPSDIGAPGAAERIGGFVAEARRQGLRRLVLLSARGQSAARPAEDAVRDSGLEWTIVRSAWFAQNFTEGALSPFVDAGELPFPAGPAEGPDSVGEPFVDADDLADVIAAMFDDSADNEYVGRELEVTGPRLLTFGAAITDLAQRTGRTINYRPVHGSQFTEILLEIGVPEDEAVALVQGFSEMLDGRNAYVTEDVGRILGRRPRDFSEVPVERHPDSPGSPDNTDVQLIESAQKISSALHPSASGDR